MFWARGITKRIIVELVVITVLLSLIGAGSFAAKQVLPRFQVKVLDGPANGDDIARSVAVDSRGDMIVAGSISGAQPASEFAVVKYRRQSGRLAWVRSLSRTSEFGYGNFVISVAVDSKDNIIAAGWTESASSSAEFTVAKWDTNGNLLWSRIVNGTANAEDWAYCVVIDSQDNVIAAGSLYNVTGSVYTSDFTVIKWAPNGDQLWVGTAAGVAGSGSALSVAVDSQDNVIAAGDTYSEATGADFTVVKWAADGGTGPMWVKTLNGTSLHSYDGATGVVVDSQDSILAAGYTSNSGTYRDWTVAKWAPNGDLQWYRSLDIAYADDVANAVAVDSQDNVIAAGYTNNNATLTDFTVAKWAADGTGPVWVHMLNGTANMTDKAEAVAVDSQDSVIAVGDLWNSGAATDFTIAKWTANGSLPLWVQCFDGTANSYDAASAVVVGSGDCIVACGGMYDTGAYADIALIFTKP